MKGSIDLSGSGDVAIVLVHGWGLDRSSWRPLRPHLESHAEIIAYDQSGFGEAAWAGGPAEETLQRHVDELLRTRSSPEQIFDAGAGRSLEAFAW